LALREAEENRITRSFTTQYEGYEVGGACSTHRRGELENLKGRPRRRWKDYIRMNLGEMG
jgi:hypothetical protein